MDTTSPRYVMAEDKNTDPSRFTGLIALSVIAYIGVVYMALTTGDLVNATLLLFVIVGYWLPSYVAVARGHKGMVGTITVNLLLGWTFVGWIIALGMALRHHRAYPVVL